MPENLTIQKAVPDDASTILKVQKSAFYAQALLYSDFSLPPLTETRDAILAAFRDHTILKAVQNGAIIGAVRGKAENGTCHVSRLVVEPGLQDNGIGNRLMTALENSFPYVDRFELFTGSKSTKSLYLYHKLGYQKCREMWENDHILLIVLEKRIENRKASGGAH